MSCKAEPDSDSSSAETTSCGGGAPCGPCCKPEVTASGFPICGDKWSECGVYGTCCPCAKVCIIRPEALPLDYLFPTDVTFFTCIDDAPGDVLVVVGPDMPDFLACKFDEIRCYDSAFDTLLSLFWVDELDMPVIYSPIVKITEYHDVRIYHDAAIKAFVRVVASAFKSPILFAPRCTAWPNGDLMTVLGALEAVYVPLQVREEKPNDKTLITNLFVLVDRCERGNCLCQEVSYIEPGRFVYRDVAMSDPERMTPILMEDYVYELFRDGPVVNEIICDPDVIREEFPLFNAVNRAAFPIRRYNGRIIYLEFVPQCFPRKTLILIGKGTAFDTGGVNIKYKGLEGMSRKKAGAAAVVGFMQMVAVLNPIDIHVLSALCCVRNNVGEHSYVPDEIVRSRAGQRVRFNNTDAEGRLIMSDVLTFMKEQILGRQLEDPHIFTLATMTNHARTYVGDGYALIMDNSVARSEGNAMNMQTIGAFYGEPFEISTLRKDDFDINKGVAAMEDLIQSNCRNQEISMRAHQVPMAFLMQSSRLDDHDLSSCYPIKYTHIDMQGSALNYPWKPASQPMITLVKAHLDDDYDLD